MNELFYTELRKTTIFVEEAITHQIFLKFQRKYFFAMIFYSLKLSHSFLVYNLCWTSIYQIFLKFQRKYFFFMIFPFIGIESFMGGTETWFFPVYCLFCLIFFFQITESWLKLVCFESTTMAIFGSDCPFKYT